MNTVKYAFFDIDNTLTDNSTGTVPDSLIKALKRLEKNGYRLSISTGRDFESIPEVVKEIYPWFSYITYNGQLIYNQNKELLRELYIPDNVVDRVFRIADMTDTTIEIKSKRDIYRYNEITPFYLKAYEFFNMEPKAKGEYQVNDKVIAFLASRDPENTYKEFAELPELEVFPTRYCYADINLKGMNKYEGIRFLQDYYGFRDYIAFGDSMNDWEMLKNAQVSVAMGDAEQKLKDICTLVTDTAGNDGIYKAVMSLVEDNKT